MHDDVSVGLEPKQLRRYKAVCTIQGSEPRARYSVNVHIHIGSGALVARVSCSGADAPRHSSHLASNSSLTRANSSPTGAKTLVPSRGNLVSNGSKTHPSSPEAEPVLNRGGHTCERQLSHTTGSNKVGIQARIRHQEGARQSNLAEF